MPSTLLQQLYYPAASDPPNGPAQMQSLGVSAESKLVQVYATTAARTSAFTAASLAPAAGMLSYITASKFFEYHDGTSWVPLPGQIVKRVQRLTPSSATTTEVGVLRLDAVPVIAGRAYRIWISPMVFNSSVAGDLVCGIIRINTAGTATTGSLQLTATIESSHTGGSSQKTKSMTALWVPSSSGSASILLSVARGLGTGSVSLVGAVAYPIDMVVEDCGIDPGSNGVIL